MRFNKTSNSFENPLVNMSSRVMENRVAIEKRRSDEAAALADLTLDGVQVVVEDFYRRARQDPLLGPIFSSRIADDAWPAHLETVTRFWASLLLGASTYGGRPMPKHAAIDGLADDHFRRWLALFQEAAEEALGPSAATAIIERAERIADSWRMTIAFHRNESLTDIKPLREQS